MSVNRNSTSPVRGSLWRDRIRASSSDDSHRSVTTRNGRLFPIWPTGIVIVVRRPTAVTPSKRRVPKSSSPGFGGAGGGGGGADAGGEADADDVPRAGAGGGGGGGGGRPVRKRLSIGARRATR